MLILTHGPTLGIDLNVCPSMVVVRAQVASGLGMSRDTKVRYVRLGALGLLDLDLSWTSMRFDSDRVEVETRLDYATWPSTSIVLRPRPQLFWVKRTTSHPSDQAGGKALISIEERAEGGARVTVGTYSDDVAYELLGSSVAVAPDRGLVSFTLPAFDPLFQGLTPIELARQAQLDGEARG